MLVYKAAAFSSMLGQLFRLILLYFFWKNVYHADFSLMQYVMCSQVIVCFVGANRVWDLAGEIKSGNIVTKLIKPVGYLRQNFILHFTEQCANFFWQGIPLAIVAYSIAPIQLSAVQIGVCIISLMLSFTICYCFDYLISLLCVFTNSIWGISAMRDGLLQILSGAAIPLYLLPIWMQETVLFFPFSYIVDTPVKILINNDFQISKVILQALYCVGMLLFALFFDNRFTRRIQIQGG